MESKYKRSVTIKEYRINAYGYDIIVPINSIVSNSTACGYDDNYYFWENWQKIVEEITGFKESGLKHDLTYYGLNIPSEFCKPYDEN